MEKKKEEFIPTRESLLGRLKDWDDHDSWREFFQIYKGLIHATALKSGLTEQEAQDVVQETFVSVAKTIKEFKYDRDRCTFKSWLRHLTQKRIADCFRKRPRVKNAGEFSPEDTTSQTPLIERIPDPESLNLDAIWEEQWQKALLDSALERVKTEASAEQYQMFDCYVLRKMPVTKVAALLKTSVAQVYLAKHRVSKLIKREVKLLEKEISRGRPA